LPSEDIKIFRSDTSGGGTILEGLSDVQGRGILELQLGIVNNNNNNNNGITTNIKKNLEAVPGKHSIDSLQKTAILGTSHIIRKVLQCEA